jgi:IS30 family transposase
VNNREVFGHWEADTIIGKAHKGVIISDTDYNFSVRCIKD